MRPGAIPKKLNSKRTFSKLAQAAGFDKFRRSVLDLIIPLTPYGFTWSFHI